MKWAPTLAVTAVATLVTYAAWQPVDVRQVEHPPSRVERLIERHHCWTNDGRTHPVPTHVVYGRQSGSVMVGDRRVTRLALEQLFDGKPHGLKVYAFCP